MANSRKPTEAGAPLAKKKSIWDVTAGALFGSPKKTAQPLANPKSAYGSFDDQLPRQQSLVFGGEHPAPTPGKKGPG